MEVLNRLWKFIYSSSCVENKTLLFFNKASSWCLNTQNPSCAYADCLSQYLANLNCSSLKLNFSPLNLCSPLHLWQVQNSLFTIESLKRWPSTESREGLLCWAGGQKGPISVVSDTQLCLCKVKGTKTGWEPLWQSWNGWARLWSSFAWFINCRSWTYCVKLYWAEQPQFPEKYPGKMCLSTISL